MSYTPIIAPGDLKMKMYPEVQALITRGDTTIAVEAIDSAISETKMYLSKYDLVALFGSVTNNTAATFTDVFLKNIVKSLAVWNLLNLANPNVDMAVALTNYEQAIASLKAIQKGFAQPDGWPYLPAPNPNIPDGDAIEWRSRKKKNNYFY